MACRIKGIPVTLVEKKRTGQDPFGAPIYQEVPVIVENVLVSPSTVQDMTESLNLYGKRAEYILGIPKGDQHEWKDSTIVFFGQKWRSFGFVMEGIESLVPTEWHKKVRVERYE